MAGTKKRRRRTTGDRSAQGRAAPSRAGDERAQASRTNVERRERKAQAREAREAARKRARRRDAIRRAALFSGVGLVAFGVFFWFQRVAAPLPIPADAVRAAEAAGCTGVQIPADSAPGGLHLNPGQSYSYSQHPATSGYHDPSPLTIPPHVYTSPIEETRAVHNLEHGAVIIYYRQSGDGALPAAVVDRLAPLANNSRNTILAPYPDLPSGEVLALAAWNRLQTCPSTVTEAQAVTIARGFIHAFVCRSAPEARNGFGC